MNTVIKRATLKICNDHDGDPLNRRRHSRSLTVTRGGRRRDARLKGLKQTLELDETELAQNLPQTLQIEDVAE